MIAYDGFGIGECLAGEELRRRAVLLIGPTGAGKTPLGECLETRGCCGRACFHFDFGQSLRDVAAGQGVAAGLAAEDVAFIKRVLAEGLLLENDTFYIAAHVIEQFIKQHGIGPNDVVILNGLPRHVGQADAVARLLDVCAVVALDCPPATVFARIRENSGGDRATRDDDSVAAVTRKLKIFRDRTLPLMEHYRSRDLPVIELCIDTTTDPASLVNEMNHALGALLKP